MDQLWRSRRIRPRSRVQRNRSIPATLLLAVSSCLAGPAASPALESYIAARDGYIRKFEKTPDCPACVDSALADLEGRLRQLVGPISVPGYSGLGKINLRTLVNEVGFDKLDALRFGDSSRIHLITTQALVEKFAARHKDLPKDVRKVAQSNAFYEYAFPEDAAFANFVRIQDPKVPGIDFALGSVGAFAQELNGMMPNQIVVFAKRGDLVFLVRIPADPVPANIPACDEIWKGSTTKKTVGARTDLRRYQDCVREKVQTPANLVSWRRQVEIAVEFLQEVHP